MSGVIDSIERAQLRKVPGFQAGDRVKVHFQVVEGNRRRTQVFEGVVLKRQGSGARETFTVRKQSFGVGVERTFPLHSPKIERIEVASRGDVRRAKLYYLRGRVGKRARVRERQYTGPEAAAEAASLEVATAFDDQGAQEDAPPEVNPEAEAPPEEPPDAEAKEPREEPAAEGDAADEALAEHPSSGDDAPAAEDSPSESADE